MGESNHRVILQVYVYDTPWSGESGRTLHLKLLDDASPIGYSSKGVANSAFGESIKRLHSVAVSSNRMEKSPAALRGNGWRNGDNDLETIVCRR